MTSTVYWLHHKTMEKSILQSIFQVSMRLIVQVIAPHLVHQQAGNISTLKVLAVEGVTNQTKSGDF